MLQIGKISPPIHHFRFSIFIQEMLKFEWQCSQYLELNPTCAQEHIRLLAGQFLQIQYIQPMHNTSEETHHPPQGKSWLRCLFSSKAEMPFLAMLTVAKG